jgi:hypothetical protein
VDPGSRDGSSTPRPAISWAASWWALCLADQKDADHGGVVLRFVCGRCEIINGHGCLSRRQHERQGAASARRLRRRRDDVHLCVD